MKSTRLRVSPETAIEAMRKGAITKIEKQALELRTQVVAMGLLSNEAKTFLGSLAPIEDAMRMLDFAEIEQKLEHLQQQDRADRRLAYGY